MGIPERWSGHRPLPEDIESHIKDLNPLFDREGVILAYLFGSLSRRLISGEYKNGAKVPHDVDLAILTKEGSAHSLFDPVADTLGTRRLDIVDLRRAAPILRMEIVRTGLPIYVPDKTAWDRFRLETMHIYRDTGNLRRKQAVPLRRRMMEWLSEESS